MRNLQLAWMALPLPTIITAIFFFSSTNVFGQTSIPDATPVTQNFDGMGSNTTLPANWRMAANGASPNWSNGVSTVTQQASSGTPITGGTYNWGTTGGSDRAVGAMTSGGFASPNNLLAYYSNTGGSTITAIQISYTAERYRQNSAAASIQFYYSLDGSTWTSVSAGDISASSFPTGSNTYYFDNPNPSIPLTFSISNLTITSNSDFYIRWNINTTGSNSQGIGVDEVSLTATFEPTCSSPSSQATNFSATNVQYNQMQVNWTRGDGDNVLVVARLGSPVNLDPTNGISYSANPSFSNGAQIGTGNYVVYNGSGTNVLVTNLASSSTYHFAIYEYFTAVPCYNLTQLTGNTTTPATPSFYFRSNQSGAWTSTSTWETSTDNNSWSNATSTPTSSDQTITIRVGHTVQITSNISFDQTVIENGATLQVVGSTTNPTLANGAGIDLDCSGTFLNSGNVSWTTGSSMVITGTYIHNTVSSSTNALGAATISPGSTWIYRGNSFIPAAAFAGRTYANLTIDGNGFTLQMQGTTNGLVVNGDFTILGTGVIVNNQMGSSNTYNGSFNNLATFQNNTTGTMNFNGSFTNSGTMSSTATGANNFNDNFTNNGSFTNAATGTNTFAGNFENNGTITNSTGTQIYSFTGNGKTIGGASTTTFETFSIASSASITLASNIVIASGFNGTNAGTLNCGMSMISGTGATMTLAAGSTTIIAYNNGISATILTTNKNYSTNANYEFQGISTGTFPSNPQTVNNITFNNNSGVSMACDITATGTVNLASGNLNLNSYILTFSGNIAGAPSWGSSIGNYIIALSGSLRRNNPSTTIFPVGTGTQYLPCRLNGAGTFNVNISPTSAGLSEPSLALPTQWDINGSGTLNMEFQWPTDIFGPDAYLYKFDGATWTTVAGPVMVDGTGPLTASFSGIGCCSGFTVGGFGALPIELVYFQASKNGGKVNLKWQTASELNNSHFIIEKSLDGKTFWEIDNVDGMGTSLNRHDYTITDETPATGINYYRLKQVDFDGQFSYSKLVSVAFRDENRILLYPTLAHDQITLEFEDETTGFEELIAFDRMGKPVKGVQVLNSQNGSIELGVSSLPSGSYFIKVQQGRTFQTLRFTKI